MWWMEHQCPVLAVSLMRVLCRSWPTARQDGFPLDQPVVWRPGGHGAVFGQHTAFIDCCDYGRRGSVTVQRTFWKTNTFPCMHLRGQRRWRVARGENHNLINTRAKWEAACFYLQGKGLLGNGDCGLVVCLRQLGTWESKEFRRIWV